MAQNPTRRAFLVRTGLAALAGGVAVPWNSWAAAKVGEAAPAFTALASTGMVARAVRAARGRATRRVNMIESPFSQLESARARRAALNFEAYDSPWWKGGKTRMTGSSQEQAMTLMAGNSEVISSARPRAVSS